MTNDNNNFLRLPSFITDQPFSTKVKWVACSWLCAACCFSLFPYADNPIVLLCAAALSGGLASLVLNSSSDVSPQGRRAHPDNISVVTR